MRTKILASATTFEAIKSLVAEYSGLRVGDAINVDSWAVLTPSGDIVECQYVRYSQGRYQLVKKLNPGHW